MRVLKVPRADAAFPYLGEEDFFKFPDPLRASGSIVAVGGNLSPGMLLSAYGQGIFPWFGPEDPIIWQSPDPRFVIFPSCLHISQSMEKIFKQRRFTLFVDKDFPGTISSCAAMYRPGQDGTWITDDMIEAYTELHRLGWVHSAEAYLDGELAGGCYGLCLGNVFFGESMFAKVPNASKAAFLFLAQRLFADGIRFIDCQMPTDHLRSLGGQELTRPEFLDLLRSAFTAEEGGVRRSERGINRRSERKGSWAELYKPW
jgi:leucyl/phenylalanyl-tRNA--protein transferase